jgi:hypothetical protein
MFTVLFIYSCAVLFVLYGVIMGFIPSDSQDLISQSIRAAVALF